MRFEIKNEKNRVYPYIGYIEIVPDIGSFHIEINIPKRSTEYWTDLEEIRNAITKVEGFVDWICREPD